MARDEILYLTFYLFLSLAGSENKKLGCGGGQVDRVLPFFSDDLSLNPAEAYSLFCKILVSKERK